MTALGFTRKMV